MAAAWQGWIAKYRRVILTTRLLFSRSRCTQSYSHGRQVIFGLQSLYRRVTPVFPAVLAMSVFGWKKETEEAKPDPEAVAVKQADLLYNMKHDKDSEIEAVKNLYAFLIEFKKCSNPELLWRLARASRDLAQLSITDTETKKSLTYESFEFAKRALELDAENFACHKWYAITLSEIGDYESTKQKISNAYEIQKHFKKAIDLNPLDATSYHLLGMWCFTIADVPWYQQKIASAIFETPPSSSFEEAIDYFERGERLDPSFYSMNQLMLAKAYLRLNKKAEARRWLEKLCNFIAKSEEDVRAKSEAEELLKRC